jgi:hypothetical protein
MPEILDSENDFVTSSSSAAGSDAEVPADAEILGLGLE